VEELLFLASQGEKKRITAAKMIRHLPPDVNLDKLFSLIDALSTDSESLEFSELAISLASLIENMKPEKVMELMERMLEKPTTKLLLGMILSVSKIHEIDIDFLAEIIRRLIIDPNPNIRNSALGALRNNLDLLGKSFLVEIVSDAFGSDNLDVKEFALTIMLVFKDKIPQNVLSEVLMIAIESEERIQLKTLETLEFNLSKRISRNDLKTLLMKATNEGSERVKKKAIELANKFRIEI